MVKHSEHWLITGGCGFIGRRLIARLLADAPAGVRVVDNLSIGTRGSLEAQGIDVDTVAADAPWRGVQLVEADIRDADLMVAASRGADVFVHLAANTGVPTSVRDPRLDLDVNVLGTFNCLEAARQHGVRRFVFASSGAPLGDVVPPIHEELPCRPVSPYGASKLAGEAYCSAFFGTYGLETVALRFGNVYGPGSGHKTSVVASFIKSALAGQPLVVFGDGRQTRDYLFIDDLVDAILQSASSDGIGGEVFQVATQRETTVGELARALIVRLSAQGIPSVEVLHADARVGDVKRNFSDISKARDRLHWHPRTDLETGLDRTVRWFLEAGETNGKRRAL